MKTAPLPVSNENRVYNDILQTIGKTPLVFLQRISRDLPFPLYAKVETFNPGGSIKDRIAVNIIEEAERSGRLKPGGMVVEVDLRQHRPGVGHGVRHAGLSSCAW